MHERVQERHNDPSLGVISFIPSIIKKYGLDH